MESNVRKILSKKRWKRGVTLPLNSLRRGITLPFWYTLSLMTLSSGGLKIFFFVPRSLQDEKHLSHHHYCF